MRGIKKFRNELDDVVIIILFISIRYIRKYDSDNNEDTLSGNSNTFLWKLLRVYYFQLFALNY